MSLFGRLTGTEEGVDKIGIHAFRACVSELNRGALTLDYLATEFNLSAGEQADLNLFITKMVAHADKMDLAITMFDLLALAETGHTGYTDEAAFWTRIDAEVVASNG